MKTYHYVLTGLIGLVLLLVASPALAQSAETCSFDRNLFVGSEGEDVLCLQVYLNEAGFSVVASGPGSPGSETNRFGNLTKAALADWQEANDVSPANGYFGPISTAAYVELTTEDDAPDSNTDDADGDRSALERRLSDLQEQADALQGQADGDNTDEDADDSDDPENESSDEE